MEEKKWYQSMTLWGVAILAICGLVLPVMGKADLANALVGETANIGDWLTALGGVIGGFLAIYGRIRAATRIK